MYNKYNEFVRKTIMGMIGNEPEYLVRLRALSWHEKRCLTDGDLEAIDARYAELAAAAAEAEQGTEASET